MGRFLDDLNEFDRLAGFAKPKPEQAAPPPARTWLHPSAVEAIKVIRGLENTYDRPPHIIRDKTAAALALLGWMVRKRVKVDGRGSKDGYRGVLDLVAHPPADPNRITLELLDPILIEFDAVSIRARTIAKLAQYPLPAAARIVVLTRSPSTIAPKGVDAVIGLS